MCGRKGDRRASLYIFELSGTDETRRQRPVIVKWFVSGGHAEKIITFYQNRFRQGTRFVAYGKWEWDDA